MHLQEISLEKSPINLLKKCPHHELLIWLQIQNFNNGLGATNCSMIDAITSGALVSGLWIIGGASINPLLVVGCKVKVKNL